jgi:hypothetical protein
MQALTYVKQTVLPSLTHSDYLADQNIIGMNFFALHHALAELGINEVLVVTPVFPTNIVTTRFDRARISHFLAIRCMLWISLLELTGAIHPESLSSMTLETGAALLTLSSKVTRIEQVTQVPSTITLPNEGLILRGVQPIVYYAGRQLLLRGDYLSHIPDAIIDQIQQFDLNLVELKTVLAKELKRTKQTCQLKRMMRGLVNQFTYQCLPVFQIALPPSYVTSFDKTSDIVGWLHVKTKTLSEVRVITQEDLPKLRAPVTRMPRNFPHGGDWTYYQLVGIISGVESPDLILQLHVHDPNTLVQGAIPALWKGTMTLTLPLVSYGGAFDNSLQQREMEPFIATDLQTSTTYEADDLHQTVFHHIRGNVELGQQVKVTSPSPVIAIVLKHTRINYVYSLPKVFQMFEERMSIES